MNLRDHMTCHTTEWAWSVGGDSLVVEEGPVVLTLDVLPSLPESDGQGIHILVRLRAETSSPVDQRLLQLGHSTLRQRLHTHTHTHIRTYVQDMYIHTHVNVHAYKCTYRHTYTHTCIHNINTPHPRSKVTHRHHFQVVPDMHAIHLIWYLQGQSSKFTRRQNE